MDLPGGQGDQDDKYIASQASLVHSAAVLDDPDFMYGCKKSCTYMFVKRVFVLSLLLESTSCAPLGIRCVVLGQYTNIRSI